MVRAHRRVASGLLLLHAARDAPRAGGRGQRAGSGEWLGLGLGPEHKWGRAAGRGVGAWVGGALVARAHVGAVSLGWSTRGGRRLGRKQAAGVEARGGRGLGTKRLGTEVAGDRGSLGQGGWQEVRGGWASVDTRPGLPTSMCRQGSRCAG